MTDAWPRRPRAATSTIGALLILINGCGAQTALTVDACGDAGSRPCENACGVGMQQCIQGRWSTCEVPAAEIACENDCGAGLASCREGVVGVCEVAPAMRSCSTACGEGTQLCENGVWSACSAGQPLAPRLAVTVRDFHQAHPDFEGAIGEDLGIVEATLGADDKPVYGGLTPTTNGRAFFDQWYRDVPGVNLRTTIALPLIDDGRGRFTFDDREFFPIDGQLFGNEGNPHNFHFTLEATATFVYSGGETFRFEGDDDVFVFINRRLVIDLGGVHSRQGAEVSLDAVAADLGLTRGESYPLHLFFAERHQTASSFSIDTTITRSLRCD